MVKFVLTEKDWQGLLKGAQDKDAGTRYAAWKEFAQALQTELEETKESSIKLISASQDVRKVYPMALRALDNEVRFLKEKLTEAVTSLSESSMEVCDEEAKKAFATQHELCVMLNGIVTHISYWRGKNPKVEKISKDSLDETLQLIEHMRELILLASDQINASMTKILETLELNINNSLL